MKEKHKKWFFERDSVCKTEEFLLLKKKVKKETKLTLKKPRKKDERKIFQEENFLFLSDYKGQGQNIFKREK